jgi:hypothetical protein
MRNWLSKNVVFETTGEKFMHKKYLGIGSICLIFGIILFLAGGGLKDYTRNSAYEALEFAEDAFNRGDYDSSAYWVAMAEMRAENLDTSLMIGDGLQIIGFLMVLFSFFLLLGGVLREEKLKIPPTDKITQHNSRKNRQC